MPVNLLDILVVGVSTRSLAVIDSRECAVAYIYEPPTDFNPKDKVLKAFGAHIFFDDQEAHLEGASKHVPSGKAPYTSDSPLNNIVKKMKKLELLQKIKELDGLN